MMNGFFVSITNNLLEDKHFERMGNAVWLYMWLIDKMTEISEGQGIVNGGRPVTYELVAVNFATMPRRTYQRMLLTLVEGGYINTMRSSHGLYITINKAKKQFGKKVHTKSDVPKSVHQPKKSYAKSGTSGAKRCAKIVASDVPKLSRSYAKSGTSVYIPTNTRQIQSTNTSTTNVVGDESPARYGKPEINELFDYWEQTIGVVISSRIQANRRAASTMQKKHGTDKVKRLIDGVAMTHKDRYAPRISDFASLQQKMNELLVWGKTKHTASDGTKGVKL